MQATYALEDRRVLGRAPRSGVLDLDPRTIMGVLLAASVVAFMSKSLTVELGLVLGVALLQALTGQRCIGRTLTATRKRCATAHWPSSSAIRAICRA